MDFGFCAAIRGRDTIGWRSKILDDAPRFALEAGKEGAEGEAAEGEVGDEAEGKAEEWLFKPFEEWQEYFDPQKVVEDKDKGKVRSFLEHTLFRRVHEALTDQLMGNVLEQGSKIASPAENDLPEASRRVLNAVNGLVLTYRFQVGHQSHHAHKMAQIVEIRRLAAERLLGELFCKMDDVKDQQMGGQEEEDAAVLGVLEEISSSLMMSLLTHKTRLKEAVAAGRDAAVELPQGMEALEGSEGYANIVQVAAWAGEWVQGWLENMCEKLPSQISRINNYFLTLYNVKGKLRELNEHLQRKNDRIESVDMLLDELEIWYLSLRTEASTYVGTMVSIMANAMGSSYTFDSSAKAGVAMRAAVSDLLGGMQLRQYAAEARLRSQSAPADGAWLRGEDRVDDKQDAEDANKASRLPGSAAGDCNKAFPGSAAVGDGKKPLPAGPVEVD